MLWLFAYKLLNFEPVMWHSQVCCFRSQDLCSQVLYKFRCCRQKAARYATSAHISGKGCIRFLRRMVLYEGQNAAIKVQSYKNDI